MSVNPEAVQLTGVVRWEEPPPFTTGARSEARTPWAVVAFELRANPGRWAVVYEGNPSPKLAFRISKGESPWFRPAGAFETTQRSHGGEVSIYARFRGNGAVTDA